MRLKLILPIVPSVNHAFRNVSIHRRILTKAGQNWRETAQLIAKTEANRQGWQMTVKRKVVMHIWVFWPDKRRRDVSNGTKLLSDSLQGIVYDDDRYLLVREMDFTVDRTNPRVEIVICLKENDDLGG